MKFYKVRKAGPTQKIEDKILKVCFVIIVISTIMEKSYKCKSCDKVFKSSKNLALHAQTHIQPTESDLILRLNKAEKSVKELNSRLETLEKHLESCLYLLKEPRQIIFNGVVVDNFPDKVPKQLRDMVKPYVHGDYSDSSFSEF